MKNEARNEFVEIILAMAVGFAIGIFFMSSVLAEYAHVAKDKTAVYNDTTYKLIKLEDYIK